jgi:peptide/nickel transport system substrate-binding protein
MYEGLMASKNVKPRGEVSGTNWHRFGLAEVDILVSRFERTSNENEKKEILIRMQELFIETAPAIPIFADPTWGVFSTKRFKNFPTESNPYAQISPNKTPENLFILTEVEPR